MPIEQPLTREPRVAPDPVERSLGPLDLYFCRSCRWFLFQRAARGGRRFCPKCNAGDMTRIRAGSLDAVVRRFLLHPDAQMFLPNRRRELRAGIAEAFERFIERQEDWSAAARKAGETAARALASCPNLFGHTQEEP